MGALRIQSVVILATTIPHENIQLYQNFTANNLAFTPL
ncbi:hypothetical protein EDB48_10549 [Vibrio crassostreae]|nr:hypothetical protein EDB48_10549 [Vibrio crassostreae]